MSRYNKDSDSGAGCLVNLIIVVVFSLIGGFCFDYALKMIGGWEVNFLLDILGGWVTGQMILPIAIVLWILDIAGVKFPLV